MGQATPRRASRGGHLALRIGPPPRPWRAGQRVLVIAAACLIAALGAYACGSTSEPVAPTATANATTASIIAPTATTTATTVTTTGASRSCATGGLCRIGDTGPSGGVVFYISAEAINRAANISHGGMYLEAAPTDTATNPAWCNGSPSSSVYDTTVGAGAANTATMTGCSEGAAVEAAGYRLNGFDDWFLPSKNELDLMYRTLKLANPSLGGFGDGVYWSSSQADVNFVWAQKFIDGSQGKTSRNTTSLYRSTGCLVRPIRAFSPMA